MSTPTSPRAESPSRTLPFPSGTYTFLPLVEACDNFQIPKGPWTANDCKFRREQFRTKELLNPQRHSDTLGGGSALDDEDDEEDPTSVADEFLVPFFLSTPKDLESKAPTRRSSSASGRPSFRLTPLPTLRPSSPTYSHPPTPVALPPTSTAASQPIGFLRPSILRALILDNQKMVSIHCKPLWAFQPPLSFPTAPTSRRSSHAGSRTASRRGSIAMANTLASQSGTPTEESGNTFAVKDIIEGLKSVRSNGREVGFGGETWAVGFEDWVEEEGMTHEVRTEHMDRVVRGWKMGGDFASALGGWRNEAYTIYGPRIEGGSPLPGSNLAFSLERSACSLFGLATFGVHCTAYLEAENEPMKIWVPRRSSIKQTWPSHLDNTVAGGITAGDSPLTSIIRECAEEASLPSSFVSSAIRCTSVLSYTYRTPEGWIQPEVQYIYDLKLPNDGSILPKTNVDDGEVESFELMEVEEIVRRMCNGEFKPNCALVLIDFFLRHGYLTPESDSRFLEVVTRLRQPLILPGPA